jgi:hypothetical protein
MRRFAFGLATTALLFAQQAEAQSALQCLTPDARGVVEVAALRSELMVLATGCHDDTPYNAFIHKFQTALQDNERAVGDLLKQKYGKRAQAEHDRFTTEMANYESDSAVSLGEDFCAHNGMMFTEVLALTTATDLPAYAAGKNLVPPTLDACTEVAEASSARRPTTHAPVKHR